MRLTGGNNQFLANVNDIATYFIRATQTAEADTVSVSDTAEGIAACNDVLGTIAICRNPGTGRGAGVKIVAHTAGDGLCHALLEFLFC